LPVERNMSTRYVTQLVAEKHRERLSARHSLLEYNPDLGTERVLEEHEKVCEVRKNTFQDPKKLYQNFLGCWPLGPSEQK